jgi:hypothetical protein
MVTEKSQKTASRKKRRLGDYPDLKPVAPPKTVLQLMREQGLTGKKVDYRALIDAAFPTRKDVEEFEAYLDDIKGRPSE